MSKSDEGHTAKEVFNMYAKEGVLRAEDLGTALRSVGRRITGDQVKALTNDASAKHGGRVDYATFEAYLAESAQIQKSFDDILAAFKVFEAKDKPGHILIDEFTHALTTLGDKLTRQEIETILEDARRLGANTNSNTIEYSKLMELIKSVV